jgi:hypothetical protein
MTSCPDPELFFMHAEDALSPEEARPVAAHLEACGACRARWDQVQAFVRDLRSEALRTRVRSRVPASWGCPDAAQLADLFRGDLEEERARHLEAHVTVCADCGAQMARMEAAMAALMTADPLAAAPAEGVQTAEPRWSAVARRPFVAAVELVVDAAAGAYTRLGSLVRDAMAPVSSAALRPVPVMAMSPGAEVRAVTADEPLTDVQVETDAMAAELVSGAVEGGGTLTVLVEKQRLFAQRAPRVTLLATDGSVVAEATAQIRGLTYRAVFPEIPPGTYLVAIE